MHIKDILKQHRNEKRNWQKDQTLFTIGIWPELPYEGL